MTCCAFADAQTSRCDQYSHSLSPDMRRRILLISLLLVIAAFGLVAWCPPKLIFGERHLRRTLALGWHNPALCYKACGKTEASIDRMISLLPMFPSIKEVSVSPISPLQGAPPLADRLAKLASSPWLVSLEVRAVDATDADIASLASMSQLEWLDISQNPRITDKGIAHLAGCSRLRHLNLDNTSVTPAGIAALSGCLTLEYLSMQDCVVTDGNVENIPRFSKMTYIVFNGAGLTEKGLEHFLTWHFLSTFGVDPAIPQESRIDFNMRFKAEWERARAAGEDVPPEKHRGRPFYVPE